MAKNVIRAAGKMLFPLEYNSTRIVHNNCIDQANNRTTIAKKIEKRAGARQEHCQHRIYSVSIFAVLSTWHML